jgi:Anti-sigma factor NepR
MDTTDQDCLAHERAAKPHDPISLAIQDGIVTQLRAMYRDLEAEPLPDHLLDLLKQLDEPRSDEVS